MTPQISRKIRKNPLVHKMNKFNQRLTIYKAFNN